MSGQPRITATPGASGTACSATFNLKNGVAIYGGFAGTETSFPSTRNFTTSKTILSGDLSGNDAANFANRGDNSYHVVSADSNPTLNKIAFRDNWAARDYYSTGGGLVVYQGSASITNAVFTGNKASSAPIDAGNNSYVPSGVTTDLDGDSHFKDDTGTTDTGAGTAPIVM